MKTRHALLALALAACTNGQGEVDVVTSQDATFPGVPAGMAAQLPPGGATTRADVTLDVKGEIDSLARLGALSDSITKNAISGPDLSVLRHVNVVMALADGSKPDQTFSDVEVLAEATEIELAPRMSDAQVLEYLREGKVVLHFTLTGSISERPLTVTHTLVAHINIATSGSPL